MRDGSNVIIRSFQGMVVEFHADDAAVLQPDRSHSRANHHFSAPLFDRLATSTVKLAQRHGRDADPKTVSVSEECFPENIHAVASVGATELFVKRADQHDAPEALDAGDGKGTRLNSRTGSLAYAVVRLETRERAD